MTNSQINRTMQAKQETQKILDRAVSYQPQFRDNGLIAAMNAHMTKLDQMLAALVDAESAMFHVLVDGGFNSQADTDAMRNALEKVRTVIKQQHEVV